MSGSPAEIWTVGHSTRSWEEFMAMLHAPRIEVLVDVRRFPGSRRNPQFSGEAMGPALRAAGVRYLPMASLGGRRNPQADSPNIAWRNAGFRGYADYMQTPAYHQARLQLEEAARHGRTALMCAEALWWQCHRSLIADDLKSRGWRVLHLQPAGREQEHPYTAAARIIDGRLDYAHADEAASPQASLF